jgi:PD-(D/E)XK nuclease superfamily
MALYEAEVGDEHLDQRLAHFFEQARPYFHRQSDEELPEPYVDFERLACFLGRLRVPLDSAEAGACSNPWLTAGLGHDEVRISGVLAALWDRRLHGDEGRAFLARFLHGDGANRVDITIETRSSIVGVEVKIYAAEGENQLPRYAKAIETRARLIQRSTHKVIFLSPYAPKEAGDVIASITWQTVAELAAQAAPATHSGWLIGQFGKFCRTLGH